MGLRTRKNYQRAWATFNDFYKKFYHSADPELPLTAPTLALFFAYLHARKLAPSSIKSYLSAIGYVHKMKGLPDPTKAFLIEKLLTALGGQVSSDIRVPISRPVLHELVGTSYQLFRLSTYPILRFVLNGILWLHSDRRASGQERECWGFSSTILQHAFSYATRTHSHS